MTTPVDQAPPHPPSRLWRGLAGFAVVIAAIFAALYFLDVGQSANRSPTQQVGINQPSRRLLPIEYLYLDQQRVTAYLGQINGGTYGQATESASSTNATNAGITAGSLGSAGASQSNTLTVQRVLTGGEDVTFDELRADITTRPALQCFYKQYDLQAIRGAVTRTVAAGIPPGVVVNGPTGGTGARSGGPLTTVTASVQTGDHQRRSRPASPTVCATTTTTGNGRLVLHTIPVGDFVELRHATIEVPPFAALVPGLSLARQIKHLTDVRFVPFVDIARIMALHPKILTRFLGSFVTNPSVTLRVYSINKADEIILPVDVADLLNSPGLMGAPVTIFGRVVRQVAASHPYPHNDYPYAYSDNYYFDTLGAENAARAMDTLPRRLRKQVGLPYTARQTTDMLNSLYETPGPATVILPLAIYICQQATTAPCSI